MYTDTEFVSPVGSRYKDDDISKIFSDRFKYRTWRKLWIALAEAEKECGIHIEKEQIDEMKEHANDLQLDKAREIEQSIHHDVMSHVRVFAEQCPKAAPIIHLGATSCYVTDNTEMIQMMAAMKIIRSALVDVRKMLADMALAYADNTCVAYTHFQPAQNTTIGKRFALWASDLSNDIDALDYEVEHAEFLGCKGAVGTADSFLNLLNGDVYAVMALETIIAKKMGFGRVAVASTQTYSRKQDFNILQVLSRIAQSASKFANDIRLLSHTGEIREGFGKQQVGSSAMPYKRNPINCEQIVGLSRYVIGMVQNAAYTASTQWLERTLDDSSNRRILIPEAFMLTKHILNIYKSVLTGLFIDEDAIKSSVYNHSETEKAERVMMLSVSHGGNRQETHEVIRENTSDGIIDWDRVVNDSRVPVSRSEIDDIDPDHHGMASLQTYASVNRWCLTP